jgi:hypothetical protein
LCVRESGRHRGGSPHVSAVDYETLKYGSTAGDIKLNKGIEAELPHYVEEALSPTYMFEDRVDIEPTLLMYSPILIRYLEYGDTAQDIKLNRGSENGIVTVCKEVLSPTYVFEDRVDVELTLFIYSPLALRHLEYGSTARDFRVRCRKQRRVCFTFLCDTVRRHRCHLHIAACAFKNRADMDIALFMYFLWDTRCSEYGSTARDIQVGIYLVCNSRRRYFFPLPEPPPL